VNDITFYNDFDPKFLYNKEKIEKIILKVFSELTYSNIKLSIIFTKRDFLSKMKETYFNVEQYTDVIAFDFSEDKENFEGEIYISIKDVKENAKLFEQSFDNEFKRVVIHGALHLVGYNDIEDKDKLMMRKMENKYLEEFNFTISS
tara:strand:- start:387 stop:824 length:438 start_codon:yes stop_codon:yes gene_type:complete